MREARLGTWGLGICAFMLLLSLPGTSEADEGMPLQNQINTSYLFRILRSYAPDRQTTERQYGKPDIVRESREHPYEIRSMPDGSRLVTMYRSMGGLVEDEWRLRRLPDRREFDALAQGTTAEEVKLIDPYFTILSGSDPDKGTSEHRLRDQGLATVAYAMVEGRWIVQSVSYTERDPAGFVSKLTPEDRAAFMEP